MTARPDGTPAEKLPAGGAMRVMGSETEYGIHAPSAPGANATMMSARIIQAYATVTRQRAAGGAETRWDYTDEEPLHDARGWTLDRAAADPSQLTDQPPVLDAEAVALAYGRQELELDGADESGSLLMNMVLGNGARLYVDHAHPEYSSPEVTNPRDAVAWDAAGDLVALATVRKVAADAGLPPINLYKNNTDNKSVSYGSHENYLMPRSVPFGDIIRGLTPFFVSRQVVCGAGRVGLGQDSSTPGYQISQRADFFEAEVGLETTIRRPIINTRDEPHATADKYRRLHVIIGDANLSQASNYLKFGTTAMVLSLVEAGQAPKIEVHEPVQALQAISHDTTLAATVRMLDGRRVTALDIQWMYYEAAAKLSQETGVADSVTGDGHTHDVLARWESTLTTLGTDLGAAASSVEWVAKKSLLEGYRNRDGLAWNDARLGLVDLQWSDIRPEKGLYYRLLSKDRMMRIVDDADIARAVTEPPSDTRAYFRGRCVSKFAKDVVGASWDSVIFDVPGLGKLQRVPTREPLRGTEALTGALFERHHEAGAFLSELMGRNTPPAKS
ncbi:proteasome accessory factor A [Paenarthrobacter nicotinovorans]|uniref:depupylase/deamidase Dop n=1 Tax=Micrococcaceae TaxID=1268 RepID=UPI000876C504|nr:MULTISPECIES: depupylase/deamidase Dop [Micrococcaceae]MDR6436328.1 proteasome accessory factor A [Paenarthrobacter nicotinovorans]SCZ57993.1 proteasome accessory factor A [Arthrobacter sp. UNCCL28]